MKTAHFIFYVSDQKKSTLFYEKVLGYEPRLNVPGMTEFILNDGCILGLMPEVGIKKLLGDKIASPSSANGIPRAELYLLVDDPQTFHSRAMENGAKELSPLSMRDWGDNAAYSSDLDGHVLVFASRLGES